MNDYSYNLLKTGLDVSALRQEAITSNIANMNTENYKANKVRFEEMLQGSLKSLNLVKTNERHLGQGINSPRIEKRTGTYVRDNGNNVDVDLEMTELAANELYYSAVVRQINSKLGNLNYVINR